eukprot:403345481
MLNDPNSILYGLQNKYYKNNYNALAGLESKDITFPLQKLIKELNIQDFHDCDDETNEYVKDLLKFSDKFHVKEVVKESNVLPYKFTNNLNYSELDQSLQKQQIQNSNQKLQNTSRSNYTNRSNLRKLLTTTENSVDYIGYDQSSSKIQASSQNQSNSHLPKVSFQIDQRLSRDLQNKQHQTDFRVPKNYYMHDTLPLEMKQNNRQQTQTLRNSRNKSLLMQPNSSKENAYQTFSASSNFNENKIWNKKQNHSSLQSQKRSIDRSELKMDGVSKYQYYSKSALANYCRYLLDRDKHMKKYVRYVERENTDDGYIVIKSSAQ